MVIVIGGGLGIGCVVVEVFVEVGVFGVMVVDMELLFDVDIVEMYERVVGDVLLRWTDVFDVV